MPQVLPEGPIVADRPLGTMIVYGFPEIDLPDELSLARRIGASVLEILPEWGRFPDPAVVRARAADQGLAIHSAHGCWGGRTIRAARVDLGSTDPAAHRESVDDLRQCVDWLARAGGRCLVVHPGALSNPEDAIGRRVALAAGLKTLAEHARGTNVIVCVENMPPGVHPGSRMADLAELLTQINDPGLALALDTGHANLSGSASAETRAAGGLLATTHVHDNNGRQDTHEPPGHGTIDWPDWGRALDAIGYTGPILLECIRHLRQFPESYDPAVLQDLARARR
jgi:sugar phosphate isomerase/epimerase